MQQKSVSHAWIADQEFTGGNGAFIELVSAWDGSRRGAVAGGGQAGVAAAVTAARAAFAQHQDATLAQRVEWLVRAAGIVAAHEAELTEHCIGDIGKPRKAAGFEIRRTVAFMRATAAAAQGLRGETLPLDAAEAGVGRIGFTQRVPYGVIAAITPFNAPANLLMQKLAPALVTGNAVIVKPAPEATRVALTIGACLAEAGVPSGLYNVLPGAAEEALALAADPAVAAVTVTGGVAAGEALARAAGAKKFMAELGGNSPNIVLKDANLADAAHRIAASAFEASGQQCISAQRVIVERSVYDAFLALFVEAAARLNCGDPALPETDLGPVVHRRAAERIMRAIEDSRAQGARLLLGGECDFCLIPPTILAEAPLDSPIVAEEVFGPAVVLLPAEDAADALRIANAGAAGLQASVFTRDLDHALRLSAGLRAGSVWINEGSRFRLDNYPFGGMGSSGHGREGLPYALDEYTQLKFTGVRLT